VAKILQLHEASVKDAVSPNTGVKRHLVVVPSAEKRFMVEKIPYWPYRPATDLRYLTGHTEPNSALVLDVDATDGSFRSLLFVGDTDPAEEKWEGPKTKPQEVPERYGLDEGFLCSRLGQFFGRETEKNGSTAMCVWYDHKNPLHSKINQMMTDPLLGLNTSKLRSPKQALHETRVIKSQAEISLMRETCRIACESITETIRRSGMEEMSSEAEVFATVDYQCRVRGASYLAYPPVVASGDHATVIHYTDNSHQPFEREDLMLMDAGCEYEGYTSDVTRTWPLTGKCSSVAQKLVFDAVHDVQTRLIDALRKGRLEGGSNHQGPLTVDSLYHESQRLFKPHLKELGLLDQDCDAGHSRLICSELCPHHVSHYLGMDVHDTPLVSRNIPLTPGMIITVEPGLYFPKRRQIRYLDGKASALKDLLGIGVRLEDDILITRNEDGTTGCEVLTESCPKSLQDIEELVNA